LRVAPVLVRRFTQFNQSRDQHRAFAIQLGQSPMQVARLAARD
jgi:hypothetical protein